MTAQLRAKTRRGGAEDFLRAELSFNSKEKILESENKVIRRLLEESVQMRPVYDEIDRKVEHPESRKILLNSLVNVAAFRSPERCKEARDQENRARRLNAKIAEKAVELADLIRSRSAGCEDISTPDDYHPLDLIERAAESSKDREKAHLFECWVKEHLKPLHRFDFKYWPTTDELLDALAEANKEVQIEPFDRFMKGAICTGEASVGDFIRALLVELDEISNPWIGNPFYLPRGFCLSDGAIATYARVALGLKSDLNPENVKKHRQRFRENQQGDNSA